jgi:hypothetical protein
MRWGRASLLWALLSAVCAGPAVAQRGQPAVPVRWLGVLDYGGRLFVEGDYHRDEQTLGNFTTKEQDWTVQEGIELDSEGYVYHTNLLEWRLGLRLGASQEQVKVDERQWRTRGCLQGYDASALVFKEKPLSARVFASHSESLRDRDFTRASKVAEDRYGVNFTTKGSFPFSLLLEQTESTEQSDLREEDEQTDHLRASLADRRSQDWLTEIVYDFEDRDKTATFVGGGANNVQELPDRKNEVTFTNLWRFGSGEQKHSVGGQARFLDREGFFKNRVIAGNQRLDLVHSGTLKSFYAGTYDVDETQGSRDRRIEGEVGLEKKIYDSLDVTLRTIGSDRKLRGGTEQRIGGFLNAAYRKKTPIGQYSSTFVLGRVRTHSQSVGGQRFIRDEAVTMTGIGYHQLVEPNIRAGSIAVTDSTDTIPYTENVHYLRRTTGAFTEIARIPGIPGGIADGDVVHVDYTATASRDAVYFTDRLTWTNRLALKKLPITLYGDVRVRNEDLVRGDDPDNLEHQHECLLGAEVTIRDFTLMLEREFRDRELSPPSLTHRARANYRRTIGRNVELWLNAYAERLRHQQADRFGLGKDGDFLNSEGANAQVTTKLGRRTLLRLMSDYSRSRGRENRMLFRNSVSLEWKQGKLDFSVDGRYDIFEQEDTEGNAASLRFSMKREF